MNDRRRYPRKSVEWGARLIQGNMIMLGTIRDWSMGGFFFTPVVSFAEGFSEGDQGVEAASLGEATLVVEDSHLNPGISVPVSIRWIGKNTTHECAGIGMENLAAHIRMAA